MAFDPKDYVFTEKYRPPIDKFVGKEIREKILDYLKEPKTMPNFLFESKYPGCGKTSLAKAIIKELNCDSLILNTSDDRNMETIRDKIVPFCNTLGIKGKKCVFLDEADGATTMFQESLRMTMEKYSSNVFFILTCNNINKISEAVQDRCVKINFSYPDKEEVFGFIRDILTKENIDYTDEGINELINKFYPSIRSMVLFLQDIKTRKLILIKENIKPNEFLFIEMYESLKNKDFKTIKEKVLSSDINPRELNSFFWMKGVEENNIKLIQLTCINERDFSLGADPKIVFVSSILEMVK